MEEALPEREKVEKIRKPPEEISKMTIETARAMIEYQEKKRAENCAAKLDALMKECNCQIVGAFVFDNSGPRITFQILALPEK